ncbi:MAG TPA: hypothetical protein VJR48_03270 [Ktedonobacterales bacterium]|nr:hypothetical protein [Ktedonobacterales bacterium]
MALRSALGLWAYTPPSNAYPLIVSELGELVDALEFTTVAPGGFGDLAAVVKLPDARIPRPELGIFSKVCLRDGPTTCFAGEWSDPALILDQTHGEYVLLSALGGGVALRDDPDDSSYTSQTAQSIIASEFSRRSAYLAVDSDQSAILPPPGAPVATFSPLYDGFNLEEILHDLCFALGDYTWTVYEHPAHLDPAGYPTLQVQAHARDVTTTHYLATGDDILGWRVTPSTQRAYNVVQVAYVDVTGGPGVVTVSDSRLNGDGSQGAAPFRRRKLRRSLGRAPLTAAQATTIAQAWLAAYQNVSNKVEVTLRRLRDANGAPIPLTSARADRNLFTPELAVRGQTLSSGPVPAVNQFYIVETRYRETQAGEVELTLTLDNYADRAGSTLAQLKLSYDAALRARGVYRAVASPGAPVVGACGASLSNQSAGAVVKIAVSFPQQLAKAPTSISLSATSSSNVSGSASATALTQVGFVLQWTVAAAGASTWLGSYQTVGN